MRYHGFYLRFVILPDSRRERMGVHRFLCRKCRRTISFLPDFCVPHKHFGSEVICGVLRAVLLLGLSVRAVSASESVHNAASFSRFCVGQWVGHFHANTHNVWHFGLERLGLNASAGPCSAAVLLALLVSFAADRVEAVEQSFRPVQCALSQPFPPFGLFRAQLLPGCCT